MSEPVTTTSGALSGRIAAVALLALAAAYGLLANHIEFAFSSDPIGPRGFPLLLAALLAIFAVIYLIRPGEAEEWPRAAGVRSVLAFMAACVVCVAAMPVLGFVLAMATLMAIVAWLFGASLLAAALSGLIQAVVWWTIFGPLVGGNLPKGPLGF